MYYFTLHVFDTQNFDILNLFDFGYYILKLY